MALQSTARSCGNLRKTVTTAGTPEVLSSTPIPCMRAYIMAETDNTGGVCIGASDVDETLSTRKGRYLTPGEGDWFYVDDLSKLYVDVATNGDGVVVFYEVF